MFNCPHCGGLVFDDTVTCPYCKTRISNNKVTINQGGNGSQWYLYYDNVEHGPMDENQVKKLIATRKINRETLCWAEGMDEWKALGSVGRLSKLFKNVPQPVPQCPPTVPQTCQHQEEDEEKLWIKCLHCGAVYYVPTDDYDRTDLVYTCDKCGRDINVSFFGYCNNCDVHIGFTDDIGERTMIGEIVKGAIKGFVNPTSVLTGLTRFVDSIPDAEHVGACPNCGKTYIECSNCKEAVLVPSNADITSEAFTCPNCKSKTRHP